MDDFERNNDKELEGYLRSFRPVPAPDLRGRQPVVVRRWQVALAGVVVLGLVSLSYFLLRPAQEAAHQGPILHPAISGATSGPMLLGQRVDLDDQALEARLAEASRRALPRTDKPNTALNVLAKE